MGEDKVLFIDSDIKNFNRLKEIFNRSGYALFFAPECKSGVSLLTRYSIISKGFKSVIILAEFSCFRV